jgi:CRP/FNR family transcriptional regulator, cyclic AMP receptor protein
VNAVNIFKTWSESIELEANTVLFGEGDDGDDMYAVLEGRVDLIIEGRVIETVESGGIIGEMALIEPGARTATAKARTYCRVARVDRKRFGYLVAREPEFALQVMQVLVTRLRAADRRGRGRA